MNSPVSLYNDERLYYEVLRIRARQKSRIEAESSIDTTPRRTTHTETNTATTTFPSDKKNGLHFDSESDEQELPFDASKSNIERERESNKNGINNLLRQFDEVEKGNNLGDSLVDHVVQKVRRRRQEQQTKKNYSYYNNNNNALPSYTLYNQLFESEQQQQQQQPPYVFGESERYDYDFVDQNKAMERNDNFGPDNSTIKNEMTEHKLTEKVYLTTKGTQTELDDAPLQMNDLVDDSKPNADVPLTQKFFRSRGSLPVSVSQTFSTYTATPRTQTTSLSSIPSDDDFSQTIERGSSTPHIIGMTPGFRLTSSRIQEFKVDVMKPDTEKLKTLFYNERDPKKSKASSSVISVDTSKPKMASLPLPLVQTNKPIIVEYPPMKYENEIITKQRSLTLPSRKPSIIRPSLANITNNNNNNNSNNDNSNHNNNNNVNDNIGNSTNNNNSGNVESSNVNKTESNSNPQQQAPHKRRISWGTPDRIFSSTIENSPSHQASLSPYTPVPLAHHTTNSPLIQFSPNPETKSNTPHNSINMLLDPPLRRPHQSTNSPFTAYSFTPPSTQHLQTTASPQIQNSPTKTEKVDDENYILLQQLSNHHKDQLTAQKRLSSFYPVPARIVDHPQNNPTNNNNSNSSNNNNSNIPNQIQPQPQNTNTNNSNIPNATNTTNTNPVYNANNNSNPNNNNVNTNTNNSNPNINNNNISNNNININNNNNDTNKRVSSGLILENSPVNNLRGSTQPNAYSPSPILSGNEDSDIHDQEVARTLSRSSSEPPTRDLTPLKNGIAVLKISKRGPPERRFLRLTNDLAQVTWTKVQAIRAFGRSVEAPSPSATASTLSVRSIQDAVLGNPSSKLVKLQQSRGKRVDELYDRVLTINSSRDSLEVVFDRAEDAQTWADAIHFLVKPKGRLERMNSSTPNQGNSSPDISESSSVSRQRSTGDRDDVITPTSFDNLSPSAKKGIFGWMKKKSPR